MALDGNGLDTVHDHVVRQPFLAQHLALEGTGDEVCHCQELFVCGVAADRISVGDIEIHLRTLESHQALVEVLGNDKDSVYLTLLHGLAGLRVGVRDELDIDRRGRLHLMDESAGDRGLVKVHYCYRHVLRRSAFHKGKEEEGREQHNADRSEHVQRSCEHHFEFALRHTPYVYEDVLH